MEEIRFCSFCGKSLTDVYNYCPNCGTQCKDIPAFEELVEESFYKLEKIHLVSELERLEKMEGDLIKLENELTLFLAVKSS